MAGLLLGDRSVRREAWLGVVLVPALFLAVGVTVLTLRTLVPSLHNVPANPFEQLIRTPRDAGLFTVVAIVVRRIHAACSFAGCGDAAYPSAHSESDGLRS